MLLYLLLAAVQAVLVDPICQRCLSGVNYTKVGSPLNPTFQLTLPALSYNELWLDFRHVALDEAHYNVSVTLATSTYNLTSTNGTASQYSLFVEADCDLSIKVEVQDVWAINRHLFLNSVSFESTPSDKKTPGRQGEYVWVINQQDNINQPFNFPEADDPTVYLTRIIPSNVSGLTNKNITTTSQNSANDWKVACWSTQNLDSVSVPYIPYFSNCSGAGSSIFPTKALQDSQWCNIVPTKDIRPVNQLMFGMTPYGDSCTAQFQCVYDEDPSFRNQYPYWQTLPSGVSLMSVSKDKIASEAYHQPIDSSNLISCVINNSEGTNSSNRFPTTVELSLNYYQVTQTESHLISCSVNFGLYTDSTSNFSYTLTVRKKPLNHTYILIAFGFNNYVYIIAFIIIGLISNIENLLLGFYHYVVNRRTRKPLKIWVYLRILKGMFEGSLSAILPLLFMLAIVNIVMLGELFEIPLYHYPSSFANNGEGPHVFWDLATTASYEDFSAAEPTRVRAGRQGLTLVVIATAVLCYITPLFVGWERPKEETEPYELCGDNIPARSYFGAKFLAITVVYITVQLALMYFAYTKVFSNNIWLFIIFMKIFQMVLQELTDIFFNDVMQCMPMKIITDITCYLNTLAANNFYDFMFSFLIDVGLNMIEKAYVASLQNIFSEWLQEKYAEAEAYLSKLLNEEEEQKQLVKDSDTLEQADEDKEVFIICGAGSPVTFDHTQEQYVELGEDSDVEEDENEAFFKQRLAERSQAKLKGESQRIIHQHELEFVHKEHEERNNITLEFTADLFGMPLSLILQPFAIFALWLTYNQSLILQNYVIDSKYTPIYLLSAVVIGVFTIINMIALFFLLQNYHGLDIEEYVQRILRRFAERQMYWKADEYEVSEDFEVKLRSVDSFCLSSQFYFLITLYVAAMFLLVVGISTMFGQSYNPLTDSFALIIVGFWTAVTAAYCLLCRFIGRLIGIWNYRQFNDGVRVHCRSHEDKEAEKAEDDEPHESSSVFLKPTPAADGRQTPNEETAKNLNSEAPNHRAPSSNSLDTEDFPCCSIASEPKQAPDGIKVTSMSRRIEELKELEIRLQSLCRKLEPRFSDDKFRMEYALRNKDYIKSNFDRLISSVEQLPEIPEDILNYDSSAPAEEEQAPARRIQASKALQRAISFWMHETRSDRDERKKKGLELEKTVKKCSFCFRQWELYAGFGGMCLQCYELLKKST